MERPGRVGRGIRAVIAMLVACVATAPIPVRAQTPPPRRPPPGPLISATLTSISPFIDGAHPLAVRLRVANESTEPLDALEVRVVFYPAAIGRSALEPSVGTNSSTARVVSQRIALLPPGTRRTVVVSRRWSELRLGLGVYPVSINVHFQRGITTGFAGLGMTAMPVIEGGPATRVRVYATVPLIGSSTAPAPNDGRYDLEAIRRAELARLAALVDVARPPIHLAIPGSLIDLAIDLLDGAEVERDGRPIDATRSNVVANAADLIAALRRHTRRSQPLQMSYVETDLAKLADLDLPIDTQFSATARSLLETLERLPRATAWLPSGLTDDIRSQLPDTTRTVIVPERTLGARTGEPFSPELFGTSTPLAAQGLRVLAADDRISERLRRGGTPALRAQTVIAETAMRWLELPVYAGDRLMVIAPSVAPKLGITRPLISGLRAAPWVQLVDDPGSPRGELVAVVEPSETPAPPTPELLERVTVMRDALDALQTVAEIIPEDGDPLALDQLDEWRRGLLIAYRSQDAQLLDVTAARTIGSDIKQHLGNVTPVKGRQITLTSRRGQVPVVLVNENPFPVSVTLRLTGRRVRVSGGVSRTVELPPGDTTIDLEVEVLGQGRFPMTVELVTPSGTVLARTRIILRSTTVSSVALIIVAGGVGFIIAQALWRRRRRRSARTPRIPSAS